jgi:hypothetical protein
LETKLSVLISKPPKLLENNEYPQVNIIDKGSNIYQFKQLFDIRVGLSGIDQKLIDKTTNLFQNKESSQVNKYSPVNKIVIEKYGDKYRLVKPQGTTFQKLTFLNLREDIFYYNRIIEDNLCSHIQSKVNNEEVLHSSNIIREIVKKIIYSEVMEKIDEVRKKSFAENLSNLIQEKILHYIVQKKDSDQIWSEIQSSLVYNTKSMTDDIKNMMKANINKERINKLKFVRESLSTFAEKISGQLSLLLIPMRKSFVLLLLEKYDLLSK